MKDIYTVIILGLCGIITALFYLVFGQKDTMRILAESHQEIESWLKHPND